MAGPCGAPYEPVLGEDTPPPPPPPSTAPPPTLPPPPPHCGLGHAPRQTCTTHWKCTFIESGNLKACKDKMKRGR